MTADAESRRAKKRQTDRNAQRQHRKRQKQYIEGLEAQISLLKSAGKTEASQIAAQNLQLQDEAFAVRSSSFNDTTQVRPTVQPAPVAVDDHLQSTGLSDLDGLMVHDTTSRHDLPDDLIHCATLDLHDSSHLLNTDGNEMDAILGDDFQLANMDHPDENDRATTEFSHSQSLTVRNKDSDHFSTMDSSQIQTPRGHESEAAMSMRWISSPSHLLRDNNDMDHFPEVEDSSSHQREKQRTPDPLDGFTELFDACMKHNLPAFRPSMSMLMFSSAAKDVLLHDMIQRASQNPESIGPPVLIDFLVDNKQNSLSTDLKMYLEPVRKTRRTSEYLATYWVLYLLLRVRIPTHRF
uniref:BZIP domain-containing protein n=1 Tax=Fusarium oxysporum (strain Fo5176) TaxID=660025 RepID=A0A0D2YE18_FUSOF